VTGIWTYERYCAAVGPEIERMAAVSTGVDPGTPVPTCPGWTLADLLEHVGAVHRWAGAMVADLTPRRLPRETMDLGLPDDPGGLPAWLAAGAEPLVANFRSADPDAEMWAWGADRHVRFWPRRMVHETCIHRVDAERAAGIPDSAIDPDVAGDGIDELLANLPPAARFSPTVAELRGNGETLAFRATDIDAGWLITLEPEGFAWERATTPAQATLAGPVTALYQAIYGRLPADRPSLEPSGDQHLLEHWLANAKI
jgi:uncharacterized protein (TIGR03083 family)